MPDCINEVRSCYAKAENELKRYERITLTNLAPAINQLRYAGHHLLKATNEKDERLRDLNVMAAKRHSERALCDVREATVMFLLDELGGDRPHEMPIFQGFCGPRRTTPAAPRPSPFTSSPSHLALLRHHRHRAALHNDRRLVRFQAADEKELSHQSIRLPRQ